MATRRGITSVLRHIPLARPNRLKKKKSQVAVIPPPHDSPVYLIPSELWQEIFRYLAFSPHNFSFRYGIAPTNSSDLTTIIETFHSLHATTLVCRYWYPPGNDVLYSIPALISSHGVELFKRTLSEAPERISPLVKEIFIADVVFRKKNDLLRPFSQQKQSEKHTKEDVFAIISSFPSLQKASICLQDHSMLPQWLLSQEFPLCDRLRKLTLFQTPLYPIDLGLTFSQLQVLCLRRSSFAMLPKMPQLHTVIFVESHFRDLIQDVLHPSFLPSLSSIELYNTKFYDSMVDADSISGFPSLDRLHLVGEDDMWTFSRLSRIQAHVPVRHLTIGIVPGFFGPLSAWRFTDRLETFTLFVNLSPTVQSTLLAKKSPLDNILECLELNVDIISSSRTLRLLVIYVIPSNNYVESQQSALDNLKTFCSKHSILVEYINAGVDQWVTKRIADITS